jgi:hypothetical protein
MAILLTLEIVQEDVLVDPKAHWLTLPISGAQLLTAKLLGVVFLVWLLPVAVLWPWWLVHHWGMNELLLGTAVLATVHALITLPAVLIAALTDSWTRFVTWAFVFVVALVAGMSLIIVRYESIPLEIRQPETAPWSQMVTGISLLIAVIVVVVLNQYLTRHRTRSLFAVGVGGLIAVLAATFWRVDFILPVANSLGQGSFPEAHLELNRGRVSGGVDQSEHLGLDVEGTFNVARGDRVYGRLLNFGWQWPNGGAWSRSPDSFSGQQFFASGAALNSEPNNHELFPPRDAIYSFGVRPVPAYVSRKLLAEPAEFRAKLELAVIHPEVLAEVAPLPGSRFGRGSERFRIVSLEHRRGLDKRMSLIGSEGPTELASLVMIETLSLPRSYLEEVRRFPAVTSEAFIFSNLVSQGETRSRTNRSGNLSSRQLGPFAGVLVSRYDGVIGPPRGYFPDRPLAERSPVLEPRWIDGLTLYWTQSRPIARMEMEIVEPHFVTREERPSQSPAARIIRPKP